MTETAQLIAAIGELRDTLQRVHLVNTLPPDLQLFTVQQILDVFQISERKFYDLKLPRYVHGGIVRYRVSDLPEHVRAHMRTFDGRPLEKRAARRKRSPTTQPSTSSQEAA
jgi:hypothetical protein